MSLVEFVSVLIQHQALLEYVEFYSFFYSIDDSLFKEYFDICVIKINNSIIKIFRFVNMIYHGLTI